MRVIVSGSSRGIGLGIAEAFLRQGCLVLMNGRDDVKLKAAVNSFDASDRCLGVAADVTTTEGCRTLVESARQLMGGFDVLVCNVGSGASVPPGSETRGEWDRVFNLNFFSAVNLVEAARADLKASQGVVICISSICGSKVIPAAPVTYSVAKAALNSYVRGISRPLADDGVRINGVAVGNILFPGSVWERKMEADKVEVTRMLSETVPLKRFGAPQDVANLVLWLASPVSAFATGSIYSLDGGQINQ